MRSTRPTSVRHLSLAIVVTLVLTVVSGMLAAPAQAAPVPPWEDTNTTWTNPAARSPKIVDLRYAAHEDFDRVVIDVRGRIPSGSARYQRRFTQDGSGKPVPIRGRSGIALALSAVAHDEEGHNVYNGPRLARPRFETLKALAFTGDFEGVVSFGFALTHRADYRVFFLHNPQRVVIDFRHQ